MRLTKTVRAVADSVKVIGAVRTAAAAITLSAAGTAFVVSNEDTRYRVYADSLGLPTVCTGHMDPRMKIGTLYTKAQCAAIDEATFAEASRVVKKYVTAPLYQTEFDILVDFVVQYGETKFRNSSLLALVNLEDYASVAPQFLRWRFAGGKDCKIRANNCYGVYDRATKRATLWVQASQEANP